MTTGPVGIKLEISMKFQNNSFLLYAEKKRADDETTDYACSLSNSFFSEVKLAVKSNLDRCQHLLNVSWKVSKLDTKVRVLGSLGFRKLVFKIYYYIPRVRLGLCSSYDGGGNGLDLALQKEGAFDPFYISSFFSKKE